VADCPRCGALRLIEQEHRCASGAIPEPVPGVYGNTATVRLPAPLTADEEAIVRAQHSSWCLWDRVWATLDAVRAELNRNAKLTTAFAADLATERAMGASMSADLTVMHQDLQRAEQERDAARAILARVVEYWSDDVEYWDDIGDDSFLTLLRDARALLAVRK